LWFLPANTVTYAEAIQFLYDLRLFGTKLGLDNTFQLAALAGNPQDQLRFIHVAGTNGKGSTCAMLESIYRAAGLRTGLYTSPHLVAFGERIQVDRQLISESAVTRLVQEMKVLLEQFPDDHLPTFFEVVTVMALRYFVEQRCDLVIWETGLGGRLDSTNIVTPLASVITNIQLDHQQWLGDTLPQIAAEKAGIIKPRVPVITTEEKPDALRVLVETASRNHAPLAVVSDPEAEPALLNSMILPLPGRHQRRNAALAVRTVQVLSPLLPVSDDSVRAGLRQTHWPGRLQIIRRDEGRTVILDGAHNPAGVETLHSALEEYFPGRRPTLILGVLADKDWAGMCRILAPLAGRILLAPVGSDRTADPQSLRELCRQLNPSGEVVVCAGLSQALERAAEDPLVVVTGSLYFVGEALEALHLSARAPQNERGLNDWGAVP
jgi:dihydrofolate synthase/folylpolyglutamate synthase